jgi:hypothetical protein
MAEHKTIREILSNIIYEGIQEGYATQELRDDSDRRQARDMLHINLLNQAFSDISTLIDKMVGKEKWIDITDSYNEATEKKNYNSILGQIRKRIEEIIA